MRSKRVRDFIIFFILVLVTKNSNNDIRNTTLLDNLGDRGPLINEPGKVPPLTQLRSLNVVHDVGLPALEYLSSLPPPDLLVPSVGAVALLFS